LSSEHIVIIYDLKNPNIYPKSKATNKEIMADFKTNNKTLNTNLLPPNRSGYFA
jgi:hypothetical protein